MRADRKKWTGAAIILILAAAIMYLAGFRLYYTRSDSMAPTVPRGSLVLTKNCGPEQLKAGDIAVVSRPGFLMPVLHRVQKIDGDWIITKGDANRSADPRTHSANAIGRQVAHIPYLGFPIMLLQDRAGIRTPVFWTIFCLILLAGFLPVRWKKEKRHGENQTYDSPSAEGKPA